jgi:hypothetical protein
MFITAKRTNSRRWRPFNSYSNKEEWLSGETRFVDLPNENDIKVEYKGLELFYRNGTPVEIVNRGIVEFLLSIDRKEKLSQI